MATTTGSNPYKQDLFAAFRAVRKLMADGNDTEQVFRIMRALNGPSMPRNFRRLLATHDGRRMVYQRIELAERLSDPAYVAGFAPGTVGAAYRAFLEQTGYSADGLAKVSNLDQEPVLEDAYLWFGRRTRDIHDIWHVLTGYRADESLGEAALVAFSYAQTGGKGWALIAIAASLKSLRVTGNLAFARAVLEGYRLGRRARWLLGEDYEKLLHEPIDAARQRLGIGEARRYLACNPMQEWTA
ncbi:Coq4 family protein [Cupriavidus taiwanensis]|uniref:Coenzyme Q (Ubiquinone) biosynthesis protein Coq4 n=2 Tax=Cupriavidus taiwanensis TaxID=164546 RepID=B3R456_CUPTR|nr:Coq4 family protein [Cupriavidus taiwanensis]CAQ69088.1 putative Coenzyme Q (ubiquinone) biosynthesis protein Coq4 [Cupriavidus taiwanensis LMG 19424]SOY85959.1 putative Coenzyme Q (ubiquinone) biosynthesis protein Coq4 [Cupriavidus taiwanensis]SOZ02053.1 putative Coenzyme Q (ubiquinone) biosynthesis protein Coq4 [Cupriavidus taiwanensis]SOZ05041.1 putative Coenzyme Q (ubiquinone) biosynthesis protein Coq4 [Cupriavidus taiwanensis]SPC09523.1 putative Coenzyme Q (ubiquinone) biosynthesis pro